MLRNLLEVFGEGDPERRRSAIEQLYTEDCVVNLPLGRYHGHDVLDKICGELRASHPSYVYTPHNAPTAVQDGGRVDWGSGPAGEPPRYTGVDIIVARDGKISALYVFLDSHASLKPAVDDFAVSVGDNDTMPVQSFDDTNAFYRVMRSFASTKVGVAISRPTAHHLDRLVAKLTGGRTSFTGIASGLPAVILTTGESPLLSPPGFRVGFV